MESGVSFSFTEHCRRLCASLIAYAPIKFLIFADDTIQRVIILILQEAVIICAIRPVYRFTGRGKDEGGAKSKALIFYPQHQSKRLSFLKRPFLSFFNDRLIPID